MRPLRLTMTAFGPYARTQVLDFADIAGKSFFLIHGPTGAGKTSILDAMSFALYGSTTGNDRKAEQMRSRFAKPDLETEVVFDFALGGEYFRVRRTPKQEVTGRGGKLVTRNGEAEMRRLAADGEPTALLASGARAVTDEAVRRLGFSCDQFRQVVMLPQGKFRELLSAGSDARAEILRQLFKTDEYADIEAYLSARKKELQVALAKSSTRTSEVLSGTGHESRESLAAARVEADAAVAASDQALTEARQANETAQSALKAGEATEALLREREAAEAELARLRSQADAIAEHEAALALSKRAESVVPAARALDERRRDDALASAAVGAASAALAEATKRLETAQHALDAEEARADEREAAERRVRELESLGEAVTRLSQAETRRNDAQQALEKAETAYRAALEQRDGLVEQEKALRASIEGAARAAERLDDLSRRCDDARSLATSLHDLARLEIDTATAAGELKTAEASREAAGSMLAAARASLAALDAAWRAGQASVLASSLAENEPCPVCGSYDHPRPASPHPDQPSDAQLEAADKAVGAAESSLRLAVDACGERATSLAALEAQVRTLRAGLGERASCSAEEAESLRADAEQELAEVSALAASCGESNERCDRLAEELQRVEGVVAEHATACEAARAEIAAAAESLAERAALVPEGLRDPASLEVALRQARTELAGLTDKLRAAGDSCSKAREDLAAATERESGAREAAERAARALSEASLSYEAALSEAGFANAAALTAALLTPERTAALSSAVGEHRERLRSAEDRVGRATTAADGVTVADVDALRQAAASAAAAFEAAMAAHRDACNAHQMLVDALTRLDAIRAEQRELHDRYALVGRLADVACGDNPLRTSFQRYVLGTFLDEVLGAASRRLVTMSRGRYRLYRALDPSDRRRSAGLDLEVFDEYTGDRRSVSTLSGGEGFLASLALALGLAEVVQAFAGGTRLETVFVDEGFGTLDEEALDEAIAMLMGLRESGRLVGIISHVAELQDRIDCRLEVTTGPTGSKATFVVD